MNLHRMIRDAGRLSDQQLAVAMTMGAMPEFIGMAELHRRNSMRDVREPMPLRDELLARAMQVEGMNYGGLVRVHDRRERPLGGELRHFGGFYHNLAALPPSLNTAITGSPGTTSPLVSSDPGASVSSGGGEGPEGSSPMPAPGTPGGGKPGSGNFFDDMRALGSTAPGVFGYGPALSAGLGFLAGGPIGAIAGLATGMINSVANRAGAAAVTEISDGLGLGRPTASGMLGAIGQTIGSMFGSPPGPDEGRPKGPAEAASPVSLDVTYGGTKPDPIDAGNFWGGPTVGFTDNFKDNFTGGFWGGDTPGFTDGITTDFTGGLTSGATDNFTDNVTGGFWGGPTDNFTDNFTGGFWGGATDNFTDNVTGGFWGGATDNFTGGLTSGATDNFTDNVTGGFWGGDTATDTTTDTATDTGTDTGATNDTTNDGHTGAASGGAVEGFAPGGLVTAAPSFLARMRGRLGWPGAIAGAGAGAYALYPAERADRPAPVEQPSHPSPPPRQERSPTQRTVSRPPHADDIPLPPPPPPVGPPINPVIVQDSQRNGLSPIDIALIQLGLGMMGSNRATPLAAMSEAAAPALSTYVALRRSEQEDTRRQQERMDEREWRQRTLELREDDLRRREAADMALAAHRQRPQGAPRPRGQAGWTDEQWRRAIATARDESVRQELRLAWAASRAAGTQAP